MFMLKPKTFSFLLCDVILSLLPAPKPISEVETNEDCSDVLVVWMKVLFTGKNFQEPFLQKGVPLS